MSLSIRPCLARRRDSGSKAATSYLRPEADSTSDGVGDADEDGGEGDDLGDVDALWDCSAGAVRALAAAARVVTMLSARESFDNSSADIW